MRNAIIAIGAAVSVSLLAMTAQALPAPVGPDKSAPAATPTPAEVQRYIAAHPNIFAQRKIFSIDQVRVRGSISPELAAQLQPSKSVEQVVALLTANNVPFDRVNTKLDAVGTDPNLIEGILKMSSDDLFAVPAGGMLLINKVTGVEVVPFTGEAATQYASRLLSRQAPAAK